MRIDQDNSVPVIGAIGGRTSTLTISAALVARYWRYIRIVRDNWEGHLGGGSYICIATTVIGVSSQGVGNSGP